MLDKTVYPGGRVFLPHGHHMRSDDSFKPKEETRHIDTLYRTVADELRTSKYLDRLELENRDKR